MALPTRARGGRESVLERVTAHHFAGVLDDGLVTEAEPGIVPDDIIGSPMRPRFSF